MENLTRHQMLKQLSFSPNLLEVLLTYQLAKWLNSWLDSPTRVTKICLLNQWKLHSTTHGSYFCYSKLLCHSIWQTCQASAAGYCRILFHTCCAFCRQTFWSIYQCGLQFGRPCLQ